MICQNCHANVDSDLIFCTNCGERLFENKTDAQTVMVNDSVVTQQSVIKPPKSSSNFKLLALIIALIAIPASIFGVYLLMNHGKNQSLTQNVNKQTPPTTPKPKNASNQNLNANSNISNASTANSNSNTNAAETPEKSEIMNERIEIAPGEHYAKPFEIEKGFSRLTGTASLLQGEKIAGFIYLQKSYDEYFPDPTYKMSSFEDKKLVEIKSTLVEENYVLIFVNDTDKPMIIQGNFSVE